MLLVGTREGRLLWSLDAVPKSDPLAAQVMIPLRLQQENKHHITRHLLLDPIDTTARNL